MVDQKSFYGYIGIQKDDKGSVMSFASSKVLEEVKTLLKKIENTEQNEQNKEDEEVDNEGVNDSLEGTMRKIVESSHSQSELLFISSFLSPVYLKVAMENEIIKPIEKLNSIVEEFDNVIIHGLTEEVFIRLPSKRERIERAERALAALPAALLMSAVATFDSNIADVVRDMLRLKPETFRAGSRTISLNEVLQAESIAEIREKFISDEIYEFSRGSHDEQIEYIEKNFNISIRSYWKRWPDFIEIFERRNLIAHGEKTFTKRYVSICLSNGRKGSEKILGRPVKLTNKYIDQAADILLEFGILLVFSLWRKNFPSQEQKAFSNINHTAFKLIENKNYRVAIRVLDYALSLEKVNSEEATRKMMFVNLASAHRHVDDMQKCLDVLNSVDWSAASDEFKICVAALRDEHVAVIGLMKLVVNSDRIKKTDFREWPVFDFIRDNEGFRAKFLEVFGEPLRAEATARAVEFSDPDGSNGPLPDAATLH